MNLISRYLAKGPKKFVLEMTAAVHKNLEAVRSRTSAKDLIEVTKKALATYDLLTDHSIEKVVLHYKDGTSARLSLDEE